VNRIFETIGAYVDYCNDATGTKTFHFHTKESKSLLGRETASPDPGEGTPFNFPHSTHQVPPPLHPDPGYASVTAWRQRERERSRSRT